MRETDSSRDDDSDDVYGCPGSTKTNINTSTRRRRFRRRRRIFARSIPTPCRSGAWEEDRQRRRPATTSRRRRTQTERTTQKRNRLNLPEEEEGLLLTRGGDLLLPQGEGPPPQDQDLLLPVVGYFRPWCRMFLLVVQDARLTENADRRLSEGGDFLSLLLESRKDRPSAPGKRGLPPLPP